MPNHVIPRPLREKAKVLGLNMSQIARVAIAQAIERIENEEKEAGGSRQATTPTARSTGRAT